MVHLKIINEQQAAKALRSTSPRLQPSPPRYSSRQHPRRPGGQEWNILEPLSRWLKTLGKWHAENLAILLRMNHWSMRRSQYFGMHVVSIPKIWQIQVNF